MTAEVRRGRVLPCQGPCQFPPFPSWFFFFFLAPPFGSATATNLVRVASPSEPQINIDVRQDKMKRKISAETMDSSTNGVYK